GLDVRREPGRVRHYRQRPRPDRRARVEHEPDALLEVPERGRLVVLGVPGRPRVAVGRVDDLGVVLLAIALGVVRIRGDDAKPSAGAFAIAFRNAASRRIGTSGRTSARLGTGSLT